MQTDPSVTVIVLNWNGKYLLKDCLGSLEKVDYKNFNVLVVDNGSTDESVKYIESTFPNVDVLELKDNIGYAAGNNTGFKHAILKHDPKIVVFLNNDTFVDPQFLRELVLILDNLDAGISAAKIYYADEPERIWFNGAEVNLTIGKIAHRNIRKMDSTDISMMDTTDYATGCCFAIKSYLFSEMNGFDENFSMYAEDVDLSLRVKNSGRKILMAPDAKIWHKVSSSVGGEFSYKKLNRKFWGLFRIYIKHATISQWLTTILCSPFLLLANIIKYFRLRFYAS